ncbi:uncharacterized protein LOC125353737 [Perognathus longimembris pacificus]|uniref:uncharacterized protein LOC125353737 n=1 Tax=Perognathus longimembris pacificus TaxID=214514 RepID=UPI0020191EBF|nr:uncharacterized protein LOC125353737 [Perognathus longimembris pacificus]
MLPFWGSLLCWALMPSAQGEARSNLFLRINNSQLKTNISDLLTENQVLGGMKKMPVMGFTSKGKPMIDNLPFVNEGLSSNKGGLDLTLVGDLISGRKLQVLEKLLRAGGLVIEDAQGPKVTLDILGDSLLQVTLRCKLYLSLQKILWLKIIKNILIGVRLEQVGNKTQVAIEECYTPPGFLDIEILQQTDSLPVNRLLQLLSNLLDKVLPSLLQEVVCPTVTTLINSLLEDLLHISLPPIYPGPDDFQYYVTSTEFTEEAILMRVLLVTPCGPDQPARKPESPQPRALPRLAQGSMADLVFGLEVYNNLLRCLCTRTHVAPVDSVNTTDADLMKLLTLKEPGLKASNQSVQSLGLAIRTQDPPIVHLDGSRATVTQQGSLLLLGPNATSSSSISWQLLSKAVFFSKNQKLELQFTAHRAKVTLGPYPAGLKEQEEGLKGLLLALLKRRFLPQHNKWLRECGLPLPHIKGVSFNQAQMEFSQKYMLLTVPE